MGEDVFQLRRVELDKEVKATQEQRRASDGALQ